MSICSCQRKNMVWKDVSYKQALSENSCACDAAFSSSHSTQNKTKNTAIL